MGKCSNMAFACSIRANFKCNCKPALKLTTSINDGKAISMYVNLWKAIRIRAVVCTAETECFHVRTAAISNYLVQSFCGFKSIMLYVYVNTCQVLPGGCQVWERSAL